MPSPVSVTVLVFLSATTDFTFFTSPSADFTPLRQSTAAEMHPGKGDFIGGGAFLRVHLGKCEGFITDISAVPWKPALAMAAMPFLAAASLVASKVIVLEPLSALALETPFDFVQGLFHRFLALPGSKCEIS